MKIRPYIIVPNLIEQPTWGGTYIAEYKRIAEGICNGKLIGQSYELYEYSRLSSKLSTVDQPSVELGDPNDPQHADLIAVDDTVYSINDLIRYAPEQVLGDRYVQKFGAKMQTLIKLTQAKGNSYQLHVEKPIDRWIPKPESWYYFEPGVITLGVKKDADYEEYKQVCLAVNEIAVRLSKKVVDGELPVEDARRQLRDYIKHHNPEQFVNVLTVKPDQAIDLSACGIHHSWEEDEAVAPLGNIVYEVQENAYDDQSTIRSFDKGKMKDDGSVRELQIDDYFKYINRSTEANDPQSHLIETNVVSKSEDSVVEDIFTSDKYLMQKVTFSNTYSEETDGSFHHLFVKSGDVQIHTQDTSITVTQGYSAFIPAAVGEYTIKTTDLSATILKTYI